MKELIKQRTKKIGLEVIKLIEVIPNNPAGWAISKQIVRSATSIGANYRAACRAKSTADFAYKLKIVEEETDETIYWLEVLEPVKVFINRLQWANFILFCVKFFGVLPAYACKICLEQNKISSISLDHENFNRLLEESNLIDPIHVKVIKIEVNEILSIIVASLKTVREKKS